MKKILSLVVVFAMVLGVPFVAYADETAPSDAGANTEITATVTVGPPAMIVVCRKSNLCAVYDANNQLIRAFAVSTGKPGHETPLGVHKIYQHTDKGGYHPMVDGTYGRWCMRFKEGGYMFHSVCYAYNGAPEPIAQEVADIGTSVSRGCVRLNVADAEWLYNATPNGCLVVVADYQALYLPIRSPACNLGGAFFCLNYSAFV